LAEALVLAGARLVFGAVLFALCEAAVSRFRGSFEDSDFPFALTATLARFWFERDFAMLRVIFEADVVF
jgi:hypothetical protein